MVVMVVVPLLLTMMMMIMMTTEVMVLLLLLLLVTIKLLLKSECAGYFSAELFCCYAMLMSYNNSETAVYGHDPALFWVLLVSC